MNGQLNVKFIPLWNFYEIPLKFLVPWINQGKRWPKNLYFHVSIYIRLLFCHYLNEGHTLKKHRDSQLRLPSVDTYTLNVPNHLEQPEGALYTLSSAKSENRLRGAVYKEKAGPAVEFLSSGKKRQIAKGYPVGIDVPRVYCFGCTPIFFACKIPREPRGERRGE